MGMDIRFEGWDKGRNVEIDRGGHKLDFIPFPEAYLIAETLEEYGIDCKKFREILRSWKREYIISKPDKERMRLYDEQMHFTLTLPEIEYLKNFSEMAMKIIEEHKEELEKKMPKDSHPVIYIDDIKGRLPTGDDIVYPPVYALVRGSLLSLNDICKYALELKRRLVVG